jgi:diacylglycerol kinase family enzyme
VKSGSNSRRIAVILNREAGALRAADPEKVRAQIEESFSAAGHEIVIAVCDGSRIGELIRGHIEAHDVDDIIVGGGDGTASSSAAQLVGTGIALGIIPLGTMNLFARSLRIPLKLDEALATLAQAEKKLIDVGRVRGQVFLHQVSFGLQPRLIKVREKMAYGSRLGKMLASCRAFVLALRQPPLLTLEIAFEGKSNIVQTPALVVSNNLYGDTHLPFPDRLDEGVLGIYTCTSMEWAEIAKLAADVVLGNHWTDNPVVEMHRAGEVTIRRAYRSYRPLSVSIDGELARLTGDVKVEVVARSLKVLGPRSD